MHKKLTSELIGLANSILTMPEDADIASLHKKSRKLYEKLSVLKFVEKNMEMSSRPSEKIQKEMKQEVVEEKVEKTKPVVLEEKTVIKEVAEVENSIELEDDTKKTSEIIEEPTEDIIKREPETSAIATNGIEEAIKAANDIKKATELKYSLENEFKDAVSADMAQEIFEGAETRVVESELSAPKESVVKKTLNSSPVHKGIQIGLNDRIAFVKYLFNGNLTDFNRVLSQLNTFTNEKEAVGFISKMVKPDYNWEEHEDIENRLLEIIERKFA